MIYDATATGCGADLTSASGTFVSPNYPQPYGHNAECFWTITTSRGSRIQLVFVDIDIEAHSTCNYDYVEVGIFQILTISILIYTVIFFYNFHHASPGT